MRQILKKAAMPILALVLAGFAGTAPGQADAAELVRIGQATPTLSFLPIYAARALDSFKTAGMELRWASISGGDPNALAALDSGDIDFAAVGSDTALNAVAKGQPFQIVYSLMSRVTLELVVSEAFLKRTGVTPTSPLDKRIAALRNATVGVSAIGGAQDSMLRWLAKQGGLDPRKDLKVAQVGPPPALQAALENGRIDAFVLSPPQGFIAAQRLYGKVLINIGGEMPALKDVPYLVLVAKTPLSDKTKQLTIDTAHALQAASAATVADGAAIAAKIHTAYFPKASKDSIVDAITGMTPGIADKGTITADGIKRLIVMASDLGAAAPKDTAEGGFWTNAYVAAAAKK